MFCSIVAGEEVQEEVGLHRRGDRPACDQLLVDHLVGRFQTDRRRSRCRLQGQSKVQVTRITSTVRPRFH